MKITRGRTPSVDYDLFLEYGKSLSSFLATAGGSEGELRAFDAAFPSAVGLVKAYRIIEKYCEDARNSMWESFETAGYIGKVG